MPNYAKDRGPRTTIWRERAGNTVLVETIRGFPFGTPKFGEALQIPIYGMTKCSGVQTSGTGINAEIIEIRLTIA